MGNTSICTGQVIMTFSKAIEGLTKSLAVMSQKVVIRMVQKVSRQITDVNFFFIDIMVAQAFIRPLIAFRG
jgi:hypothetical protein